MLNPQRRPVIEAFLRRFDAAPEFVVRAPGRVNLIGEHTDYQGGFVLPAALEQSTWIALRRRADTLVKLEVGETGEQLELDLRSPDTHAGSWRVYPAAVAWALQHAGHPLAGWEGVELCTVPQGAGLASSASFELALARAFAVVSGIKWNGREMALLCREAEQVRVGVPCGIMDQMIGALAVQDHALLIDCRSLETKPVPLPPAVSIAVMDTGTRRELVSSSYGERRRECEEAAARLGRESLRDVTPAQLGEEGPALPPLLLQRARHVVGENQRTLRAVSALEHGDAETVGRLMTASHVSLRDDFEVSSRELNVMVEIALGTLGCLGARMTGAGFGGCAVALVWSAEGASFLDQVRARYQAETGIEPHLFLCRPSRGAELFIPEMPPPAPAA